MIGLCILLDAPLTGIPTIDVATEAEALGTYRFALASATYVVLAQSAGVCPGTYFFDAWTAAVVDVCVGQKKRDMGE